MATLVKDQREGNQLGGEIVYGDEVYVITKMSFKLMLLISSFKELVRNTSADTLILLQWKDRVCFQSLEYGST